MPSRAKTPNAPPGSDNTRNDKKVRTASRGLLREPPSERDMARNIIGLKRLGHHAAALMGASYLEHALELALKARFRTLNSDDDTRMWNGAAGGILGGFASKIRMSYALGIVHENPYMALLLINDIRNVFAHSLHKLNFRHKLLMDDCNRLREVSLVAADAAALTDQDTAIDIYVNLVKILYNSLRASAKNQ